MRLPVLFSILQSVNISLPKVFVPLNNSILGNLFALTSTIFNVGVEAFNSNNEVGLLVPIPKLPLESILILSFPFVLNNKLLVPVALIFKFPRLLKIGVFIETLATNAPVVIVAIPAFILLLLVVILVLVIEPLVIDPVVLKLPEPKSSFSVGFVLPIPTLPLFFIIKLKLFELL